MDRRPAKSRVRGGERGICAAHEPPGRNSYFAGGKLECVRACFGVGKLLLGAAIAAGSRSGLGRAVAYKEQWPTPPLQSAT